MQWRNGWIFKIYNSTNTAIYPYDFKISSFPDFPSFQCYQNYSTQKNTGICAVLTKYSLGGWRYKDTFVLSCFSCVQLCETLRTAACQAPPWELFVDATNSSWWHREGKRNQYPNHLLWSKSLRVRILDVFILYPVTPTLHPLDLWISHWLPCSSSWPSSSRMLFTKCGVSAYKWTHNIPCQFRPLHSRIFIPPYQLSGLWFPHCSLGQSLKVFPLSPLEWKIGDRNLISVWKIPLLQHGGQTGEGKELSWWV